MKRTISFIMAAAMCGMLAACGGNNANSTPTTSNPSEGGNTSGSTALAATQEYTTYLASDPMTLDLNKRSDTYSSTILINTLEGLTRLVDNADSTAYEYAPAGAKSWSSNAEGTVWTFVLNENYWEDGQKVTAQDYVYSMQRYVNPETGSPLGYKLDVIKNYNAINKGEMTIDQLGVKALDENTLEITLEAPCPYFMDLTHGMLMRPQRQDIVEKHGDKYGSEANTVISNGPFKITSWTHNNLITLEKNDKYWDAENVKLNKVNVRVITDTNTANNAFANGEIDYISTGIAEWIDRFDKMNTVDRVTYPTATLTYSFFNNQDDLFKNANVRKAFVAATNREEINDMCFGGTRIPTYGWVVPTLYAGDINYREYAGDPIKELIAENPDPKALLLKGMEELGLGNDPSTLKIKFRLAGTDEWFRTLGEYLQQTYKTTLGINLEIDFSEWGIFIDNVAKGNYQIGFMAWGASVNDPIDVLSLHTSASNAIYTGWSNPEYDALIAKAASTMDDKERAAIYKEAEYILIKENAVANPLATSTANYFYKNYVKGYSKMPLSTGGFKYMYLLEH